MKEIIVWLTTRSEKCGKQTLCSLCSKPLVVGDHCYDNAHLGCALSLLINFEEFENSVFGAYVLSTIRSEVCSDCVDRSNTVSGTNCFRCLPEKITEKLTTEIGQLDKLYALYDDDDTVMWSGSCLGLSINIRKCPDCGIPIPPEREYCSKCELYKGFEFILINGEESQELRMKYPLKEHGSLPHTALKLSGRNAFVRQVITVMSVAAAYAGDVGFSEMEPVLKEIAHRICENVRTESDPTN